MSFLDLDGAVETSLTILQTKYDKWSFYSFTRFFSDPKQPSDLLEVIKKDGEYFARFGYHQVIQITLNEKNQEKAEHESQHVEGYKWLYQRTVEQFKQAEERSFESREEARVFGKQFYENNVIWRPFKWKLYSGTYNPLAWLFHQQKWEQWAKNKDWN